MIASKIQNLLEGWSSEKCDDASTYKMQSSFIRTVMRTICYLNMICFQILIMYHFPVFGQKRKLNWWLDEHPALADKLGESCAHNQKLCQLNMSPREINQQKNSILVLALRHRKIYKLLLLVSAYIQKNSILHVSLLCHLLI
jgi:hypothetical protein